jgi:hypothetical protein
MIEVRIGVFGWRFIIGDIKELGGGRRGGQRWTDVTIVASPQPRVAPEGQ